MTDVIMPQMGESIAEGTITKWMKKVGDRVQRDEPLFEISTDKVDAEIPAPASGVLKEIRVEPGATVPINTVVGVIGEGDAATVVPTAAPAASTNAPAAVPPGSAAPPPKSPQPNSPPVAAAQADGTPAAGAGSFAPAVTSAPAPSAPAPSAPAPAPAPVSVPAAPPTAATPAPSTPASTAAFTAPAATPAAASFASSLVSTPPAPASATPAPAPTPAAARPPAATAPPAEKPRADMTPEELRQTRSSPVVRKIAAEHNVDISKVPGTGIAGRVTKQDILGHIETRPGSAAPSTPSPSPAPSAAPAPSAPSAPPAPAAPAAPTSVSAPSPAASASVSASAPAWAPAAPAASAVPPSAPSAPPASPDISATPTWSSKSGTSAARPASAPPAPSTSMPTPAPSAAPAPAAPAPAAPSAPSAAKPAASTAAPAPASTPTPFVSSHQPGERVEIVPMLPIRKKTSEHMVMSKRISAHVTTVSEIDMSRVAHLRHKYKQQYQERSGVKLTYMPFIVKATVDALKAFPVLNASVDGDNIVYKKDLNIGIAVALDWGLIVPVLRNADEKNVLGLARAINDVAERARGKKLKIDEVQGGTFTITNPGVFGSLFGTPIINQPQVGILAVGTIEKRAVVRDDAIAIRTMCYLALSFDHRIVDGADADKFMAHLKKGLQEFDESAL